MSSDFYCDKVLSGKIQVKIEYESDKILAFHHTKPSYEYHIVIIPKEHISDLTELSDKHQSLIWEIINTANKIIRTLDTSKQGIKLITNLGKYQDSSHLHFLLISGNKIS